MREEYAAEWLRKAVPSLIDMSDLTIAQLARQRYLNNGQGFRMSAERVAADLGIQHKHAVKRLKRLTESGIWTRDKAPQGSTEQYRGYVYYLAGVPK